MLRFRDLIPWVSQFPSQFRISLQPAVLRYGGVPLFTRNFIKHTQSQDIAFNLFFGKPILIGEHHDTFKDPESLLELVQNINSIAPGISWSNTRERRGQLDSQAAWARWNSGSPALLE